MYKKLPENIGETSEPFHFDYFRLEDGELYYRGRRDKEDVGQGKTSQIKFFEDKVTAEEDVMLNRVEDELPSASDIAKVNDIELQEIMENAVKSMEDLIAQFEGQETLPM